MKRILALMMASVLMCSTPVMASSDILSPNAARKAAEVAEANAKAHEAAAREAEAQALKYKEEATAAQAKAEQAEANAKAAKYEAEQALAKAQAETAKAAAEAAKAEKAAKSASAKGNTYTNCYNKYEYKITITNGKSTSKKNPKIVIKNTGGSNGGTTFTVSEPPFVHTVLSAPGLDNVMPVGQGGKLVIGGVKTRATFVMRETTSGKVSSAKVLAAQVGGSVKNVVETYAPGVRFSTCQVDFKVYGCKKGDSWKVYQLCSDGNWSEVQVNEIRDGHIVCTVSKTGTFAFIKMN